MMENGGMGEAVDKAKPTYVHKWFVVRVGVGGSRIAPERIIQHGACKGLPYPAERQGEAKVERSLRDAGYGCYFPKMRKEVRHKRTKKRMIKVFPLFVGYIFVSMASRNMDFRTLRDLDHVGPVVKVGEEAVPVPDQFVASVLAAEQELQFDDTEEARILRGEQARSAKEELQRRFAKGARVRVEDGPLAGFHGHVTSTKGRSRVQAMIELFGRETTVEFNSDQVIPLAKRSEAA